MKTDTYQMVTDRIIAKLESGTIPWKHFASSPLSEPKNLVSKKPYHGINHLLLTGSKYGSPYWLTYHQAEETRRPHQEGREIRARCFLEVFGYRRKAR